MSGLSHCTASPTEIRAQRRSLGLKQAALADLLGVNQATVSRWESGRIPIESDIWTRLQELRGQKNATLDWPREISTAKVEGQWPALLKQFRMIRNLSQEQLADITGHATESISRWETGRFVPSLSAQLKLRDLILSPLDNDSQLRGLLDRIERASGHVGLSWGSLLAACSKPLLHTNLKNRYDIKPFDNLHDVNQGKFSGWMSELSRSGLLKGSLPLSTGNFVLSENDARTIVCFSVPCRDVPGLGLSIHLPWEHEMDAALQGKFDILHPDQVIV